MSTAEFITAVWWGVGGFLGGFLGAFVGKLLVRRWDLGPLREAEHRLALVTAQRDRALAAVRQQTARADCATVELGVLRARVERSTVEMPLRIPPTVQTFPHPEEGSPSTGG